MTLFEQVDLIGTTFYRIGKWFPEMKGMLYEEHRIVKIIGDKLYVDDKSYILEKDFYDLQSQETDIFKRIFLNKEEFDKMFIDMIKDQQQYLDDLSLGC